MALFAYIFNGLPNCVSALKWLVCVTKDDYWVKFKKSSGKPVQHHTKQSLPALFSANSPQKSFSPFKHCIHIPWRITAGYQLCTAWIQMEVTERELPLLLKMALEMVRKKYQRIPVQASSTREHRTKYYRK